MAMMMVVVTNRTTHIHFYGVLSVKEIEWHFSSKPFISSPDVTFNL
jgi:hypothetical protein